MAKAELTSNDMGLLRGRDNLFSHARSAADRLDDPELGQRTANWLARTRELLVKRDEVVHSIVITEREPEWKAYHPRLGRMIQKPADAVIELATHVAEYVATGMSMSLFEWPDELPPIQR